MELMDRLNFFLDYMYKTSFEQDDNYHTNRCGFDYEQ